MSNLEKVIEGVIEEYLSNIDPSDFANAESLEDIILAIDPTYLSREISELFKDRSLSYHPTPKIGESSTLYCEKCGRSYGSWFSSSGVEVNSSLVQTPNKTIVIMDDF